MIKTVIIDVDDTLCLTESACFELENETLRRMGVGPMPRLLHQQTWGQPLFDAIGTRSPGIDVEQFKVAYHPVIAEFVADGRLDSIPARNYAAMDSLIAQGKQLILLTSRTFEEFEHLLAPEHQLAKRITTFYYKDIMAYHKPDPRAFDEALHDNQLRPDQCVYVGDTLSDAAAANGAGIRFIASLESGLRQQQDFEAYDMAGFIASFSDVVDAVQALDSQ